MTIEKTKEPKNPIPERWGVVQVNYTAKKEGFYAVDDGYQEFFTSEEQAKFWAREKCVVNTGEMFAVLEIKDVYRAVVTSVSITEPAEA